jgi:hypothetical protein
MSSKSFNNADKTHRAAIATKIRDQTSSGCAGIPVTINRATKVETIRQAAERKRHKTKPHQPEED